MSRAHNGHHSFSPLGIPFRMIFPKKSHINSEYTTLVNSFEQSIAEGLKKLKPEDISHIQSLSWLSEAMNFLSSTHNNLKILITDLKLPVSDWEAKWIDLYLDDSVKLLDICIAISSKLSQLEQGRVLLKYASNTLNSSEQIDQARTTLSNWVRKTSSTSPTFEKCYAMLHNLAKTTDLCKGKVKARVLNRAMYGVKSVTILVCSVCMLALSRLKTRFMAVVVPGKFLWASAFTELQTEVLRGMAENEVVLKEVKAVENYVENLCALDDCEEMEIGVDVSDMAEAVENLSHGLDGLSKRVENFFDIVLTGRNALLCSLRICEEEGVQESGNLEG